MNKLVSFVRSVATSCVNAVVSNAQKMAAVAVGLFLAVKAKVALAVDPTYTSQIGDALGAVDMSDIITDVGAFSGMGFNLILTVAGVFFAAAILISFLRKGRG